MNAVGAAPHDPIPQYHEIAAEARMSELLGVADSFGFECLGDIGPAPPEARLSYYVEYGPDPREPELRLFIACSASPPMLPKPAPRRQRKPRKPTLASVAKQASKAAIAVASYEVKPDGTIVIITGTPDPATESNPWLAELDRMGKQ
jgi:hypothetical protein